MQALNIGINNYPGTNRDLYGCVNDARLWQSVLNQRGFNTTLLLDAEATLKNIVGAMLETISATPPHGTTVITYSGHGTWVPDRSNDEPDKRDEALCPYDITERGPLLDDVLLEVFSEKPNRKIIFISDSCHSGTLSRFTNLGPSSRSQSRFLSPEIFLSEEGLKQAKRTRTSQVKPLRNSGLLLAACQDAEYAYDSYFDNKPHGAFTFYANIALAGLNQHNTFRDWMKRTRYYLPSASYPQSPIIYGTPTQRYWPLLILNKNI